MTNDEIFQDIAERGWLLNTSQVMTGMYNTRIYRRISPPHVFPVGSAWSNDPTKALQEAHGMALRTMQR